MREALGEYTPDEHAGLEVERIRYAGKAAPSYYGEYDGKGDDKEHGLKHNPDDTEKGLRVPDGELRLDDLVKEIPVASEIREPVTHALKKSSQHLINHLPVLDAY